MLFTFQKFSWNNVCLATEDSLEPTSVLNIISGLSYLLQLPKAKFSVRYFAE